MDFMNEQRAQHHKPLRDSLLERIESEKVCPYSRLFFQCREFLMWSLWLLSVVVGAFAIAVTMFVVVHGHYAFYEATHENFLTFMVEALPYLWIVTFVVMVYVAVYNIRHTKRGYRYPLWVIMASSVMFSLAGGSLLQLFGFGYEIDEQLGKYADFYTSQGKFEQRLWQNPSDGRLVGKQIYSTLSPTTTVILVDVGGQSWTMNTSELPQSDVDMLASQETVRVLGKPIDEDMRLFHACGVFPWMHERELSIEEMIDQRQNFLEHITSHAVKSKNGPRLQMRGPSFASTTLAEESICATIAPVRRLPPLPKREE